MIRRLLKNRKQVRKASPRRRAAPTRVPSLQTLEERALLAVLTNGLGEGQVFVEVNEQGAFGNSPNLAVNIPNRPSNNSVSDAVFNPAGPRIAFGTTYESGLAIRIIAPGTSREFLTAGTIGNTGNNASGFFFNPSPDQPQNNLERNSRFFWPNNVTRPSNANDIPAGARLRFDLRQTLVDLQFMGSQDGTSLVQEYTIQNVSGAPISFELVRYWDGDLFSTAGGGAGNTPLLDGGGERIFDVRRGVNGVFQTDTANNNPAGDPTFHEIQSSIDNVPRTGRWEVGLAGDALPNKPIGPLLSRIIAGTALADDVIPAALDGDDNDTIDTGSDDDIAVALRQEFLNVPVNGFVVFQSITVFGHPPRGTVPAPVPEFGQAEGTKYIDRNSNGVRDPGEPGVPGFRIYADLNQNGIRDGGEPSMLTDQNGAYSLSVPIGMTEIREEQQPFWTQTGPITGFHIVDIQDPGDIVSDLDFGNVPDPGEIRGVKFDDDNRNGVQDPNEPGMEGVTIFLDADDDGILDLTEVSTTTDVNGNYSFTGVEPGEYVVREIIPAGFDQTVPGGDGAHRVIVTPAQILTGVNFGNRLRRGSITGVKWNDLNGDGVFQPTEPRVAGAIIYIDENEDGRFNLGERAAITNAYGEYEITELLPGQYIVREVELAGSTLTYPPSGFHQKLVFAGLPTPFVNFGNRANYDFGDAPDSYGTLLASNGARHAIVSGFHLGARIDGEPDGQPTPDATGDDANGGGFGSPVNFAVGDQPSDVVLADITGDGNLDLVTANRLSNNISLAVGNGDGTFGPAIEFDVESNPVAVFPVDFNNDGRLDLAVAHEGDSDVAVLINNGSGGFVMAVTFPAGGTQSDIVAFDYDGDGDIDIAVTRPATNDVAVLPNVSSPTLEFDAVTDATTFLVQQNPVALELGRINSDSLLDMVVVNQDSNTVSVLRNLGSGLFATAVNYVVGAGPSDVTIADLDGDGDRDMAVANTTSGTVTVLRNNGFGVFPNTMKATYNVPGGPVSIVAGPFDGKPGVDLAVALQASNSVAVLSNNGDGTFPAAAVYATGAGPAAIATANLDGDSIADLVTANFSADTVSVLNFEGSDDDGVRFGGPFVAGSVTPVTINASAAGFVSAWIDFNRNGVFDASERVLGDAAVIAGNTQFFITTPAGTPTGPVIARFRYSAQRGLAPIGPASSGEVEDYQIQVQTNGVPPGNTGWTNLVLPEDVDANGRVELFDVLTLVNDLRANGVRALPTIGTPPPPPPFLDVNGNGLVELNDVLRVINRLLTQAAPEPEGEADDSLTSLEMTLDDIAPDVCVARSGK